ncbi:hypothetical protein GCK32_022302, partial [Trichostrongylus colubriformis]
KPPYGQANTAVEMLKLGCGLTWPELNVWMLCFVNWSANQDVVWVPGNAIGLNFCLALPHVR